MRLMVFNKAKGGVVGNDSRANCSDSLNRYIFFFLTDIENESGSETLFNTEPEIHRWSDKANQSCISTRSNTNHEYMRGPA